MVLQCLRCFFDLNPSSWELKAYLALGECHSSTHSALPIRPSALPPPKKEPQESALWGAFDAFDAGQHDGQITLDVPRPRSGGEYLLKKVLTWTYKGVSNGDS